MENSEGPIRALRASVRQMEYIIGRMESALSPRSVTSPANVPAPARLELLQGMAVSLRSLTTKLALVTSNLPVSPDAVATVLHEITFGPLQCMVAVAVACTRDQWGKLFSSEVRRRVGRVIRELRKRLGELPSTTAGLSQAPSMTSTGVIWTALLEVCNVADAGLGGLIVEKVTEQRNMLEDAIAELERWSQDNSSSPSDSPASPPPPADDTILGPAPPQIPEAAVELRQLLRLTLYKLGLIRNLYVILIRGRLGQLPASPHPILPMPNGTHTEGGTFPPITNGDIHGPPPPHPSTYITRLDSATRGLMRIAPETDDLASSLYELDAPEAARLLDGICALARAAALATERDWRGEEDEHSVWVPDWVARLDAPETPPGWREL
ncbi:MAG: hypothetical protein M1832_004327 [Thelocarpon impressellum]|nr:MAG: hypothetical protein M1832_004327 [Thelocarpon impressellum]